MTLEHEFQNLDPERAERAAESLAEQLTGTTTTIDMLITPELQEKYAPLVQHFQNVRNEIIGAAQRGDMAGPNAQHMISGAQFMVASMIEYAEAEAFEQAFDLQD